MTDPVVILGSLLSLGFIGLAYSRGEINPCMVNFSESASGVGVLNRTFNGVEYCEYLGIRYAEAPVGPLRFKSPVLRAPNGTEQFTKYGSICAQLDSFEDASNVSGEEDCLFLNVYRPVVEDGNQQLPVLVYIHGGSYAVWSPQTDMFGVDLLMESGVMIVSFNYRLSVLGFLRHPEFNITGNYGLKDHLAALQWVQNYIEHFGGNPNNVTLMGQSVGAHSVTYHMFLEPFRGLFHRVIAMSGSVLAPSAMNYIPEKFISNYLQSINVTTYGQLMSADFKDLFAMKSCSRKYDYATVSLPIFLPMVEDEDHPEALVTKPVHELILTEPVNKAPLMIGMTSLEFTSLFANLPSVEFSADDSFPNRQNKSTYRLVKAMIDAAAKLAHKFDPNGAGKHFFGKLADLSHMYYPVKRLIRQLEESDSYRAPIFYYRFEFDGRFGKYKNVFYKNRVDSSYEGAMHGDDLGYLFSPYNVHKAVADPSLFEMEWKVSKRNVGYFGNFVKFGNPTPEDVDWKGLRWPAHNEESSERQFLNINREDEVMMDKDRSNFIFQIWSKAHDCLYYYLCVPVEELYDKINNLLNGNRTDIELQRFAAVEAIRRHTIAKLRITLTPPIDLEEFPGHTWPEEGCRRNLCTLNRQANGSDELYIRQTGSPQHGFIELLTERMCHVRM